MGAHDQVDLPGLQGLPALSFLGHRHGPGEEGDLHPGMPQKGLHGLQMLLGQQLRGGHEGGLTAILPGQEGTGSGHHGLARANVTLEQAVHGDGLGQIPCRFPGGPELGIGEGKGQGTSKGPQILLFKRNGLVEGPPPPDEGEAQVQAEEFLEHEPPLGGLQVLPGVREVDGPVGELHRGQLVLPANLLRQGLPNLVHAPGSLPLKTRQEFGGDSRRQGVDRHDAPGEGGAPLLLKDGIHHLPSESGASRELAVEVIGLPRLQCLGDEGLVEEGDVHLGGAVHHPAFGEIHALADEAGAEGLCHHGGEADRLLQGKRPDVLPDRSVLIVPGEEGQQVGHGIKSQLGQGCLPGRTDAGELGYGGM